MRRWRFGRSSEKVVPTDDQLGLALSEHGIQAANDAEDEQRIPAQDSVHEPPASSRGKRSAGPPRGEVPRGVLPEHLPRETIVHEPGHCTCPACGHGMRRLGEDISEQLDWVPGYFRALRHVRPKLSCAHCAKIVQLPAPSRPIERGLPTPSLLAHVLMSKFGDHQPLYRQSVIFRRSGLQVERATLAGWVASSAALVEPLVDALGAMCCSPARCTPTIRRCRCSIRGAVERRRADYGRTCAMIGRPDHAHRRRCGTASRPIASRFIRRRT